MAGTRDADFLGRGWAFPVAVQGGAVVLAEAENDIAQAVRLILDTAAGERLMRPEVGSRLEELVFAPNNDSTRALAAFYVKEALDRWEPRIDVIDVQAAPSPEDAATLLISIDYVVRASNVPGNLVYPFYLQT